VRSARAAVGFLTRLPVGGHPFAPSEWAWAPAFFPGVGLALGAIVGRLYQALVPAGALCASALAVGASLILTGALHEDGLADTFDALGAGGDRTRLFEILKDSRVGVFGVCALIVSLFGRMALIVKLGAGAVWALALAGCAARVGPVWLMVLVPYVPHPGSKSHDLMRAGVPTALAATAWVVAAWAGALAQGLVSASRIAEMAGVLSLITLFTARLYLRRAGGITGDFLGATEQLGELGALMVLAWVPG
jgi:adenosylcobinamide-GDP ribazoletransferase